MARLRAGRPRSQAPPCNRAIAGEKTLRSAHRAALQRFQAGMGFQSAAQLRIALLPVSSPWERGP